MGENHHSVMFKQDLVVPTNGRPGNVSRFMWFGSVCGMWMGPGGMAIGAGLGYFTGKYLQNDEITTNKKLIRAPTFWNSGLVRGITLGNITGMVAACALCAVFAPAALSAFSLAVVGSAFPYAALTAAPIGVGFASLGVWGLLATIGGIKGSNARKAEMKVEYAEAEKWHAEQKQKEGLAKTRQKMPEPGKQYAMEHEPPPRRQSWQQEMMASHNPNTPQIPVQNMR